MKPATENTYVQKALTGDRSAFESLVNYHYEMVYCCAFRFCRNKEDAEDIAQEVFMKVAVKLDTFGHRSSFSTWLYRITMNCAKDMIRKNSKVKSVPYENGIHISGSKSNNPGSHKEILQAIDTLPDNLKETVILVFAEGMSHKQAADILQCAETTISWRIFKAKKKLRVLLS